MGFTINFFENFDFFFVTISWKSVENSRRVNTSVLQHEFYTLNIIEAKMKGVGYVRNHVKGVFWS